MSKARFRPGSSFGGVCYYPLNAEAKAHVERGRKTVSGDDLVDLITSGVEVQLNVSQYINIEAWVDLTLNNPDNE